jgi:hypothetical protein
MANEYVSQVLLEVDGMSIDDFSSVTEKEVEYRKSIQLMNKFGFVGVPRLYGLNVDYVVPKDAPEVDFTEVMNGTLTIDKENGVRVTYTGVYHLKTGDTKYEPGKEATQTIELAALKKNPQ